MTNTRINASLNTAKEIINALMKSSMTAQRVMNYPDALMFR